MSLSVCLSVRVRGFAHMRVRLCVHVCPVVRVYCTCATFLHSSTTEAETFLIGKSQELSHQYSVFIHCFGRAAMEEYRNTPSGRDDSYAV